MSFLVLWWRVERSCDTCVTVAPRCSLSQVSSSRESVVAEQPDPPCRYSCALIVPSPVYLFCGRRLCFGLQGMILLSPSEAKKRWRVPFVFRRSTVSWKHNDVDMVIELPGRVLCGLPRHLYSFTACLREIGAKGNDNLLIPASIVLVLALLAVDRRRGHSAGKRNDTHRQERDILQREGNEHGSIHAKFPVDLKAWRCALC